VLDCRLADDTEHRRRIEARGHAGRSGPWGVEDWAGLLAYQARIAGRAGYELATPGHTLDLGQPLAVSVPAAAAWLRGLAEPSVGWMPRARWEALVRGEGCPLCAELASTEAENAHGFWVADLSLSRLQLAREQHVPGWCVLICRRHVREPHELPAAEQRAFFDDLVRVGEALERVYAAAKMNYQLLGNLVPHLHAHIQPRAYGDPYPGQPVPGPPREPVHLSPTEYRQRGGAIRAALSLV
jgi:diadenosine tetraphosphate (Ap4A) HIT family hydrolase